MTAQTSKSCACGKPRTAGEHGPIVCAHRLPDGWTVVNKEGMAVCWTRSRVWGARIAKALNIAKAQGVVP